MGTLRNVILQGLKRHRHQLMALILLALEATSFVLDQTRGNRFGFRITSCVLSVITFLMTGYIAMRSKTDIERELIMIELAFSVVQLILSCLHLASLISRFKFKSTIESIYPLVLTGTTLVYMLRHNELVQDPAPNTQERDEEEGFAGIPDNLSRVNSEEEIPHTAVFISPVGTSTMVDETPDSRVLLPVTTQSSIMVNEEETARVSKQEEISEKSRASLISSDAPMMSKNEKIAILTTERSNVTEEIAEETARVSKQEEISEKSRASLISSDGLMMSKDEKIAILTAKRPNVTEEIADPTAAPTTPAISF